jgi:hypothetical protein
MMNKYDSIYINGDSYSAPIADQLVYGDYLKTSLDIEVVNRARRGSSNHRIFRTSLEDLSDKNNCLAIIGLSFITRDETWYEGNDPDIQSNIPDTDTYSATRLITLDYLMEYDSWQKIKDNIVDMNVNRQLTHFYTNLFMFANTLENLGIDYFIFSAADNQDWRKANWPFITSLKTTQWCSANKNIHQLHKFCIPKFAQENNLPTNSTGHLYADGHEMFSKYLIDTIKMRD